MKRRIGLLSRPAQHRAKGATFARRSPFATAGYVPVPGWQKWQRGIATIEFALGTPVLLLLMLATAELGQLLVQYNTLTKAVRDGARYAVTQASVGTTRIVNISPAVRDETRNLVVTGNTAGQGEPLVDGLTVEDVSVTDAGNGFVAVSATYTYQPILGAALPSFGTGDSIDLAVPLSATVLMRALP